LASELKPFFADESGTFHTSNSVRDWAAFGYTYPEITSGDPAAVRASINVLYGDQNHQLVKRSTYPGDKAPANATESDQNPRDYVANIRASKTAQGESYTIRIFLGDFTSDPNGWSSDPNLVGTHGVFAKKMSLGGEPVPVSGAIMLRKKLRADFEKGKISGLTEDVVVPYLTQNLHWRVQKVSSPVSHLLECMRANFHCPDGRL
jgi:tyrosinase